MGSHRRLDLGAAGMAGLARLLDSDLTLEAAAAVLAWDGLTTSAIEGECFAPEVLRSSVARHLGLPTAGLPEAPPAACVPLAGRMPLAGRNAGAAATLALGG
jgi:hypothetical protein